MATGGDLLKKLILHPERSCDHMYARVRTIDQACVKTGRSNVNDIAQIRATPLALNSAKTIMYDRATIVFTLQNVNFSLTATVATVVSEM